MGQTSNPTLRYPDGTDRPRAVQLKNLAEDTRDAFQQLRTDLEPPQMRRFTKSATQTIPSSVATLLVGWDPGAEDPGNVPGGINYSAGLFTVPAPGAYLVSTGGFWAASGPGSREVQLRQNGVQRESYNYAEGGTNRGDYTFSVLCFANAGDTLGVAVRQTSGGNLLWGGSPGFCYLTCAKVA